MFAAVTATTIIAACEFFHIYVCPGRQVGKNYDDAVAYRVEASLVVVALQPSVVQPASPIVLLRRPPLVRPSRSPLFSAVLPCKVIFSWPTDLCLATLKDQPSSAEGCVGVYLNTECSCVCCVLAVCATSLYSHAAGSI